MADEDLKKLTTEEESSTVSDADVETTILGFFLPDIVKHGESRDTVPNKNIFKLVDDQEYNDPKLQLPRAEKIAKLAGSESSEQLKKLPALINVLTSKAPSADKNICQLPLLSYDSNIEENSLFLNQALPYVRLYKTFQREQGEKVELEIPFDIVGNHLSSVRNEDYQEQFEKRILDGGSGGSVGITNFKWTSEGKNEGNNSMFSVSFTVFIQNVSELTRERNKKIVGDEEITVSILDLLYPTFTQEGGKFKFKDLPQGFDPAKMALKAEVGYNYSSEKFSEYDLFFKTVLYLHLYKHNFVFKDDGSIELTINYIGNIESTLVDKTNVLLSPREERLIKAIELLQSWIAEPGRRSDIQEQLKSLNLELVNDFLADESQRAVLSRSPSPTSPAIALGRALTSPIPPAAILPLIGPDAEKTIKKLRKELASVRINAFFDIFNILKEKKKIFGVRLNRESFESLKEIVTYKQIDDVAINKIKEKIKNTKASIAEVAPPTKSGFGRIFSDAYDKLSDSLGKTYDSVFNNFKSELVLETDDLIEEMDDYFKREEDKIVKYYVYLEDLIQVFIDYFEFGGIDIFGIGRGLSEEEKGTYDIHLSSFTYMNYQTYDIINQNETLNYVIEKEKKLYNTRGLKREITSLGYIPISIDSLSNFYNEKIVKLGETSLSFNQFLKDIFTILAQESISSNNTPNAPKQKLLTNRMFFESASEKYFTEMQDGFIGFNNFSKLYQSKHDSFNGKKTRINLAFLSSAENNMESFKGNRDEDCERNILHFYVNYNKGILKEASFSRDDNQRLETANLLAAVDAGPNKIIRQVYHCKLKLFGNCFFEPGQLIYISPNYPGSNLSLDALFKIGLGGYYRIIKIDNSVSPGSFDTDLDCRWEMFGTESAKNPTSY